MLCSCFVVVVVVLFFVFCCSCSSCCCVCYCCCCWFFVFATVLGVVEIFVVVDVGTIVVVDVVLYTVYTGPHTNTALRELVNLVRHLQKYKEDGVVGTLVGVCCCCWLLLVVVVVACSCCFDAVVVVCCWWCGVGVVTAHACTFPPHYSC